MQLGGGRATKDDCIDPRVGVILCKKLCDPVDEGEVIAFVHAADKEHADIAVKQMQTCYEFSDEPVDRPPFIHKILRGNE